MITDAISTQDWPGEAGVDVSLVNWVKNPASPPTTFILDGEAVDGITAELRTPARSTGVVARLSANKSHCFQGPIPAGTGFVISEKLAKDFLAFTDVKYRDVIRPYIDGDDIAEDPRQEPRRWTIDFAKMKLEEASKYPKALDIVRRAVKPVRETDNRAAYRHYWWQFAEARREMRVALEGLPRFISSNRVGKRLLLCWTDPWTCPSDLANVFAFDDDYAMGILSSSAHGAWAKSRSSTLEDRLRYTSSSVFETFPWPYPVDDQQQPPPVSTGDRQPPVADQRQQHVTRTHRRGDYLGEIIAQLDRVNILEHLAPAEMTGKPVEQPPGRVRSLLPAVAHEDPGPAAVGG